MLRAQSSRAASTGRRLWRSPDKASEQGRARPRAASTSASVKRPWLFLPHVPCGHCFRASCLLHHDPARGHPHTSWPMHTRVLGSAGRRVPGRPPHGGHRRPRLLPGAFPLPQCAFVVQRRLPTSQYAEGSGVTGTDGGRIVRDVVGTGAPGPPTSQVRAWPCARGWGRHRGGSEPPVTVSQDWSPCGSADKVISDNCNPEQAHSLASF